MPMTANSKIRHVPISSHDWSYVAGDNLALCIQSGMYTPAKRLYTPECAKLLYLLSQTGHGNVKGPLAVQKQSSSASEAMVELTSRLHLFKERRLQLMDQLTSLDPRLIPISLTGHDLMVELQSLANP